ncbi:MAG: MBL fold metallo-hydrolase [Candidatus Parvarchaeota archaeon]|nr:MBL fold metallo-hydrolase [Candidatus Parvarchaeota archaeon]
MENNKLGQKLNDSLHEIYLGKVKAFLLEATDGSLILIDTGMPKSSGKIISYVNNIGKSVNDIKYILLTHAHIDHFGSAADIKKLSGAMLGINEKGVRYIDGTDGLLLPVAKNTKSFGAKAMVALLKVLDSAKLIKPKFVKPDMILKEGVFPESMHMNAKILETPGHTADSISIYLPDTKTVIVGDLLKGTPSSLIAHPFFDDYISMLGSIKKVRELAPDLICVSHGKNHNVSDLKV